MASSSKEEMPNQETSEKFPVQPLTATEKVRRLGKVKVYGRRDEQDKYRLSPSHCDDAAVMSVIRQHGMSSLGMECRLTLGCSDDDPFIYVFVEALQLLQDWLSKEHHFANVLQVAHWEKRENVVCLLQSFGEDFSRNRNGAVQRKILCNVLTYHGTCQQASTLLDAMLHSEREAMIIRLLEGGFELILSRFDDHVLEARAAARRDALKCVFHVLSRVITDYSYYVDILSTALDIGHECVIRNTLQKMLICRLRVETDDICQKLFNAAVRNGNPEVVRILIQLPQLCRYVNVNSVIDATAGDTPLHLACRMGSTLINQTFDDDLCSKAVRLVFRDSDDNPRQEDALSLPCLRNYYRFVAAVAGTDEYPETGLDVWRLMAMSSEMQKLQLNVRFDDYAELTHLLIRHRADLYATNRKGETALHVIASLQLHGSVLLEMYALSRTNVFEQGVRWKRNCRLLGTLKRLQDNYLQEDERKVAFMFLACDLFTPNTIDLLNPVVRSYFENVTSLIRILLEAGIDINLRTSADETALSIAADEASKCIAFCRQMCKTAAHQVRERATEAGEFLRANVFTVVRELLINNADWRTGRSNGIDLLNIALHSNQTDLLVELICQGAEPASWPEYLILVFESEDQSVIRKTLATLSTIGVTVDIRNEVAQTALHIAAERDLADVVRDLIHFGADVEAVDNFGRNPLETAVQCGCSNAAVVFQRMLPAGLSSGLINISDATDRTSLHIAAEEDHADEVVRLLGSGADVGILDGDGRSPLVTALVYHSWDSARALLDHGPDVVTSSRMNVVIDAEGSTVLHHLSSFQTVGEISPTPIDIFRRILADGVSADVRDFNGNTPLHTARQLPELSQLLIEHGADVNAQNSLGETPLHVAFRAGDVELVRCLVKRGSDLRARDDFFNTPFHCDTSYYSNWKLLLPDLPPSAVGSQVLNVFGARTVFHFMAFDDSRPRLAQIDTDYRDYLGNTALHVAAGVYGHKFRNFNLVHYDDDKQEDLFSSYSDADLSIVNSFGQTPLHLKWLDHRFPLENDGSLHQKDGRGRTSWHHMFIFDVFHCHALRYIYSDRNITNTDIERELEVLRMFPEVPAGFQSKRCVMNVAGCNEADDLGRTPLHYAAMHTMCCINCHVKCSLYCKSCTFLFGVDSWSTRDKWGRTPLHYAYLKGQELPQFQINALPLELTDADGIRDIDGYTPKQMLDSHMLYRDDCQIVEDVERSCFANFKKLLRYCCTEEFFQESADGETADEHLMQLWPAKDATGFLWNIWTTSQYAYRDPEYVVVHAAVLDFMRRLVVAVGEEDHRLEGTLHQVGSSFEGTRVGYPDEFDFNVELVNLNSIIEAVTSLECPNGFAHLVKKPGVNLEHGGFDQFFDENGTLLATAVNFWFQSTWIKVLSWQKFWDTEPFFEITGFDRIYRLPPNKLVKNINLRFNRPINGKFLHYNISIDIVPVVRVEGWWPDGTIPVSGNIRALGCNFVFDQPRRKHGAAHSTKPYVRISFARAESMSIRASPPVVRAAYMVAKQIISQHLDDRAHLHITSHTVKIAVLWSTEVTNLSPPDDVSSEHPYDQLDPHQLQRQVEALFRRLRQFCVQDFVPSFFMPSVRVAVWSFEKFPKHSHTFLQRTYTDYRKLFEARVEPSGHVALAGVRNMKRTIKTSLAYSFMLLYAVSSHGSWSTDWVFPIIDD